MHLLKQKKCLLVNETDSLPPVFASTAVHALSALDGGAGGISGAFDETATE